MGVIGEHARAHADAGFAVASHNRKSELWRGVLVIGSIELKSTIPLYLCARVCVFNDAVKHIVCSMCLISTLQIENKATLFNPHTAQNSKGHLCCQAADVCFTVVFARSFSCLVFRPSSKHSHQVFAWLGLVAYKYWMVDMSWRKLYGITTFIAVGIRVTPPPCDP